MNKPTEEEDLQDSQSEYNVVIKGGVNIPISKKDLASFPNHSIIETGVYPNRRQRRSAMKKKR